MYQATRENTELRQTLRGFATELGHVGEMVVTPLRLVKWVGSACDLVIIDSLIFLFTGTIIWGIFL